MEEAAVSMRSVSKRYANFSLREVSLDIPKGYITGMIGGNGSGKTTLIKLLTNLIRPDSGEVRIFGRTYADSELEIKSRIGFVYEDTAFFQHETVKRIEQMVAPFYPTWSHATFERYRERFRLPLGARAGELSKGMGLKLFLALALSHEAELLVLDEPTSGLDPIFRRKLSELFAELMQDENRTIVLSTHIASDLDRIADYVALLHDGRLVFHSPKDDLLNRLAIVRGPRALLDEGIGELLIGARITDVGFEALTRDISKMERMAGDARAVVVEKPCLEDIMVYFNREGWK